MSRAFVREEDTEQHDTLPELKISPYPNYVTRRGHALIEDKVAELERVLADNTDEAASARAARDLRYWTVRRETAQLKERGAEEEIGFGTRVRFRRDGGAPETVEIVGEDESDPHHGRLSWVAPLAKAMLGTRPGDIVTFTTPQKSSELEILAVEPL
jgi:transcription elongation GreA/GreB family factor